MNEIILKSYPNQKNEVLKICKKNSPFILYTCGPTVYDDVHIGNLRGIIMIDLLINVLKTNDIQFYYYQNITDIDDKIIKKAKKEAKTEQQISSFYTKEYQKILQKLNLNKPIFLFVTKEIEQMINFIESLEQKNLTYKNEKGVFFKTSNMITKTNDVQNFSKNILNKLKKENKEQWQDFVLWKIKTEGKKWNSKWGQGRPGWHSECAFFVQLIQEKHHKLDLHGGGIDLMPIHHQNEALQFKGLNKEKKFTQIWWRHNMITINKNKISKSKKNFTDFFIAKNFLQKYSSNILKMFFYNRFIEKEIDWNDQTINIFQKKEEKIQKIINQLYFLKSFYHITDQSNLIDLKLWNLKLTTVENYLQSKKNENEMFGIFKFWTKIDQEIKKIIRKDQKENRDNYQENKHKFKNIWLKGKTMIKFQEQILGWKFNFDIQIKKNLSICLEIYQNYLQAKKEKDYLKGDLLRKKLIEKNLLLF